MIDYPNAITSLLCDVRCCADLERVCSTPTPTNVFRSKGDDVFVGQNFIHESDTGEINEGDVLEVLETKEPLAFTTAGSTELASASVFGRLYHAHW